MTHGSSQDSPKSISVIPDISVITDTEFGFFLEPTRPGSRQRRAVRSNGFQSHPVCRIEQAAPRRGGADVPASSACPVQVPDLSRNVSGGQAKPAQLGQTKSARSVRRPGSADAGGTSGRCRVYTSSAVRSQRPSRFYLTHPVLCLALNAHHDGLQPTQLEVVLTPPPQNQPHSPRSCHIGLSLDETARIL
jgi:hypothetical protein